MKLIFDQIQYDTWVHWCPIIGFLLSFSVFVVCLWRAMREPKSNLNHMATLPLDESETSNLK